MKTSKLYAMLFAFLGLSGGTAIAQDKGLGKTLKDKTGYKEGEISSRPSHDFFSASLGLGGIGFTHFNVYVQATTPVFKRLGAYGTWAIPVFNSLKSENPVDQSFYDLGLNFTLFGGKSNSRTKVALSRSAINKGDKYRMIYYTNEYLDHYTGISARGGFMQLNLARHGKKGLYRETAATHTPGFPISELPVKYAYQTPYIGISLEDKVNSKLGRGGKIYNVVYKKKFYFDVLLPNLTVSSPTYSIALDTAYGVSAKSTGYRFGYGVSNAGVGMDFDLMLLPYDKLKDEKALFTACLTWRATFMISQFFTKKKAVFQPANSESSKRSK